MSVLGGFQSLMLYTDVCIDKVSTAWCHPVLFHCIVHRLYRLKCVSSTPIILIIHH